MSGEAVHGSADDPVRVAVHRTMVVVDIERFSDHGRTNPNRLVVRQALYRAMEAAFTDIGVDWTSWLRQDRGDGILVLVPPEVAKSLFVERLPTALAAHLDEHNSRHEPPERIRLRVAVHAGEVYPDGDGVVGHAVNHVCRLVDSDPLRRALADAPGAVALMVSDWFFEEVVRHSLAVDARRFRSVEVVMKETDSTAWVHTGPEVPEPRRAETVRNAVRDRGKTAADLWRASADSVRRLGSRRTAYPVDLSIAELHDRGLYVPAAFAKTGHGDRRFAVDDIAAEVAGNGSVLILGEPGSGKSVAAYAVLRRLRDSTPALAVRASELRRMIAAHAQHPPPDTGPGGSPRPALLIDGLDESLGEFDSPADLSELLRQARERFAVVVTCRHREFEDNLAPSMDGDTFDSIYAIGGWTLDDHFTDFVRRLVAGGLLPSDRLLDLVRGSPDLSRMVTRPLYARMVTFLGHEGLSDVGNVSALYAEYIDRLAAVSDAALARAGCARAGASIEVWIDAAWLVFQRAAIHEDRFDFGAVSALLSSGRAESARCTQRALSQLCNRWRSSGRVWGSFIHYSFFEYLVSRHYVREIEAALTSGEVGRLAACLHVDPTPEVRHFLVDELRITPVPGLGDVLEAAFRHVRSAGDDVARVRVTGNLVAYLLSRAAPDGRAALWRLFHDEDDIFLEQAVLWGLCHLGDREALRIFVDRGRESTEWRAWNRGYLMYYYGDIDHREEPPHVDSDKLRGWTRTRERTIALMTAPDYPHRIAAARRYLDLYTFYDYAIWREEALAEQDGRALRAAETALLRDPDLDPTLLRELDAMRKLVAPTGP
ncbi:hypothetical protein LZG04_09355 [Saccharothrix sp. S26]|uniref:NACHT domain-containing protein n=1 Tax=Saccharothrix sp. S26 TaxID=2907215 RepID=UPI001F47DE2D|nr:hypothetical protein [Saccharothrix sp. S26]MCE6995012.1 hypothetical protein [Saccharothrix sp. S26]